MNALEMRKVLSGPDAEKKALFDTLMAKGMSGEPLEDHEVVVMEALKKLLFKAE